MMTHTPPLYRRLAPRRAVALLTAVSLMGCGATSTVTLNDGREYEAVIERSDADALYLAAPAGRVARRDVRDIDYPGGGAIVLGWVLTGLGATYGALGTAAATGALMGDDPDAAEIGQAVGVGLLVMSGLLAGAGLPILIDGYARERTAREASHPPGGPLVVHPFIGPTGVGVRF